MTTQDTQTQIHTLLEDVCGRGMVLNYISEAAVHSKQLGSNNINNNPPVHSLELRNLTEPHNTRVKSPIIIINN